MSWLSSFSSSWTTQNVKHFNIKEFNICWSPPQHWLWQFVNQYRADRPTGIFIPMPVPNCLWLAHTQQVVLCRRGPCIIILQSGMMWGHTMRLYVCTKWAGPYLCHGSNCYYCVWLTTVSQKNFKPSMSQNQVKTQKFHSSSLISWDLGEGKPFQGVHHHADIV